MSKNRLGIEPRDILMNASLNIITYFVLGETLVFDQPEFKGTGKKFANFALIQ